MGIQSPPVRAQLPAALAVVYVVWGSTYVALKVGVENAPPLGLSAVRFLIAGALLYAWCAWRRWCSPRPEWRRPTPAEWRAGTIQGVLLPAAGTGGATWAEQRLPSGTTALLLATIPVWLVITKRLVDGEPIGARAGIGLLAGLAGVAVLVNPFAGPAPDPLYAGALLTVLSAAGGEFPALFRSVHAGGSMAALGYLIVFGSLLAYSTYEWLLHNAPSRIVGTYAFVNPVVAVVLGWWLLGERVGPRTVVAAGVIAIGVALIVVAPRRRPVSSRTRRAARSPRCTPSRSYAAR